MLAVTMKTRLFPSHACSLAFRVAIFALRVSLVSSTLNLDELRDAFYDVEMKTRPFALDAVELRADSTVDAVMRALRETVVTSRVST